MTTPRRATRSPRAVPILAELSSDRAIGYAGPVSRKVVICVVLSAVAVTASILVRHCKARQDAIMRAGDAETQRVVR